MTIRPRCSAIRVKSSGNCQNVPAGRTCKRSIEAQVTDRHDIFDEEAGPDAISSRILPDGREKAGFVGVPVSAAIRSVGGAAPPNPRFPIFRRCWPIAEIWGTT